MEKAISKPLIMLIVLFLTVFSSAEAASSPGWTVNPADYRYDMSLYLDVSLDSDGSSVDYSRYDIAAFVGNECRGVAKAIPNVDNCRLLRIYSNKPSGENVTVKIRNKETGEIIESNIIPFEADKKIGEPSNPYKPEIAIYYDVNITAGKGGSVDVKNGRYPKGTELKVTATPDEKYRFSKWSDGVTDATRQIVVDKDITLQASFEISTYTITYVVDGKTLKTVDVECGANITPEEAPAKEGYTFSKWEGLPETMPTNDITVNAVYTVNKYKLAYVVDGTEVKSTEVEFGSNIVPEEAPVKEGYTFSGWQNLPETMPASDVTVTGSFSVNSYKLTYIIDGETYKQPVTIKFGEKITPEEAPVKEGYTFSGWQNLPETMPANDVTVTGSFSVNSYKLTYVIDGETYKQPVTIKFGEKITPEEAPVKEGYTFSGWQNLPETMPANDVTVTGSFAVNSYKLTYVIDGETYKKPVTIKFGEKITPEEAPVKEGYTFSGWQNIPETMPANDVTITGSFAVNSYKLTYVIDGETYKSVTVEYGAEIVPENNPEKNGHTFSGWQGLPATMPAKDVTVTGSFSANYYTITYIVDDKKTTAVVMYGTSIPEVEAPVKEGYTFVGWENLPETMPAYNIDVKAKFTVNSYRLTYTIDGENYKTVDIKFNAKIEAETAPAKEGYDFIKWEGLPETMPAHDLTVSALYSVRAYKLTYTVDGKEYKSVSLDFGTEITPEKEPAKEGHTFSGWEGLPKTMPAHDVTVAGKFTVNSYKAVFKIGDEVIETINVEFGKPITAPKAPEKEGYSFSGWQNIPETMPAKDIEITGSYSKNSYKLTYLIEEDKYLELSVEYGAAITPEEEPVKEGYTFFGWEGLPETMPAHDVVATGYFSLNYYRLTYLVDDKEYDVFNVAYGSAIKPIDEPLKEGHTFSGWEDVPKTMPSHNVVIKGRFSVNTYKLTYTVDGEEYKSIDVLFGAAVTPEKAPEKEGHTFSGWSDVPQTMPAKDVTVTGSFSINSYKLTYTVDGEEYKSIDVLFGAAVTPEKAPEKEGHTFSGWSDVPQTMPAKDVTVTGSFKVNSYKLTYTVDGKEYKSIDVLFGAAVTPEKAPEKEGYTFSGWSEIPQTMPAKDVTVTGSFKVNSYKLTYIVDGKEYKSVVLEFGAKITPEKAPEKEGYTFSGWEGLPKNMPAEDVTVEASYTVNSYKLTVYLDDEIFFETELEMGAPIEIPVPEVPADRTFDGWADEIPATMPARDLEIHGSTSAKSGLSTIFVDGNTSLTVYNLNGVLLLRNVTVQEANDRLAPGIYIINGKKIMIR